MDLLYDRGTLVLKPSAGERAPARLATLRWDPRVEAWRAPACHRGAVLAELAARRIQARDHTAPPAALPAGLRPREPPLADHQAAALASWEARGRRGLVVLPTGAGKTRVGVAALARVGAPALVLVPTRVLLEQWAGELARWCEAAAGRLGDGWRDVRPITVATYESASRRAEDLGARFALVVADEAHHAASGRWADCLWASVAPARLGLTATLPLPGPAAARLEELIGPVACARTVAELTPAHLAPLERVVVEVALAPADLRRAAAAWERWTLAARAAREEARGLDWPQLARALARTQEGRRALAARRQAERLAAGAPVKLEVARALLARHADDRTLVFTADNEAAYALSCALLVPAITTDVRGREREGLLAAFREGRVRALVSSAVLNEGLDVPDARVAVVLGGRLGRREHVQRVGRILRPSPGKTAVLYEVVARGTFEDPQRRRRELALPFPEATRAAGPPS